MKTLSKYYNIENNPLNGGEIGIDFVVEIMIACRGWSLGLLKGD